MQSSEVYRALDKLGAAKAVVAFSGGNDEGGVDDITLVDKEGKHIGKLDVHGTWSDDGKHVPSKDEALVEALGAPVDAEYGSFAGDFYVSGHVVWDVAARTYKMGGHYGSMQYSDFGDLDDEDA